MLFIRLEMVSLVRSRSTMILSTSEPSRFEPRSTRERLRSWPKRRRISSGEEERERKTAGSKMSWRQASMSRRSMWKMRIYRWKASSKGDT